METKLNVTKGVVTASKKVSRDTILAEYSSRVYNDDGEPMAIVIGRSESETKDNALLVEDSFNTHNTTGYTPSQLLEQNRELVEALIKLNHEIDKISNGDKSAAAVLRVEKAQRESWKILEKHSKDV